jgi:hypothetical protein
LTVHHSNEITIIGTLEAGVEAGCVLLHGDDGAEYLLTDWSNYPPYGSRVMVTGHVESGVASHCMQGSAAIRVSALVVATELSFSQSRTMTTMSFSFGSATASSATVMGSSLQQSTTLSGVPITVSGFIYTAVETPRCYPQCLMPSLQLTYLYIPPGTSCTGGMQCYPPPRYYRLLRSDDTPFPLTAPNGTHVTALTGLLVAPSAWNCESFYVPKICMVGDIYAQTVTY